MADTQADVKRDGARMLPNADVSAFCEGMALMLSAGIQTDEALLMMSDSVGRQSSAGLARACHQAYEPVAAGKRMSEAMRATGVFPAYALEMIAAGEKTGRLEEALSGLAQYYDEADRMFARLRGAVGYPAALLCVMAVIVAVTVVVVLPVFESVYARLAGSLTAASSGLTTAANAIGWVALALTIAAAAVAVITAVASRSPQGNTMVLGWFSRFPLTREPMRNLALSRFCSALSTYLAAGFGDAASVRAAAELSGHHEVKQRAMQAADAMEDPQQALALSQAIGAAGMLAPLHARLLSVGAHSGSSDEVLAGLSATLFDEAIVGIDAAVDSVEPILAALLTIGVSTTLVAVMIPLIGIMGSIG